MYLLTINVRGLASRPHFLARFLAALMPQICGGVELLVFYDDGEVSSGAKCQRMLEASRGRFVVWLDEDDEIAPDYVAQVLKAIRENPYADYIGYRFERSIDDGPVTPWMVPMPLHITPVRRDLAMRAGFPDRTAGEDNEYSTALRGLGAIQGAMINSTLYTYRFRTNRDGERRHEPFNARERCPA